MILAARLFGKWCIWQTALLFLPGVSFGAVQGAANIPRPLETYADAEAGGVFDVLRARAAADPLNVAALVIFLAAILHTFFAPKFRHWAHVIEERAARQRGEPKAEGEIEEKSFAGAVLHFFGEVEAVFGLWAVVLAVAITWLKGWSSVVGYIGETVSYTEPIFVVVIMAIAATRPVTAFAESALRGVARLGKGTPAAWWLAILILAPLMGSFITEPAAMTIGALLLGRQFYALNPSAKLRYATLGLLFVNVSIGGTLTHFAAPPVIMVARPWGWGMAHMFSEFGWRSLVAIVLATVSYWLLFRKELGQLKKSAGSGENETGRPGVPFWVVLVHLGFLAFTVWQAHHPALCVGGFLFFVAFTQATEHHQDPIDLRPPVLVGFFLAGLVIHGGLQGWWIQPILGRLSEFPLFLASTGLTAFNDNAAITYLATLVPTFTDSLKHAVVAGAVAGGGLTVIANAPNPAGQAILGKHFAEGISPLKLALAALWPTVLAGACLMYL
jgi:hypothetical protein